MVGCGATTGSGDQDDSSDGQGVDDPALVASIGAEAVPADGQQQTLIAIVSLPGSELIFTEVGANTGEPSISYDETFDLSQGSVVARVTEQQPLTALEIFMSLQPDAEVPPLLVAHHAREAYDLGRPDDAIVTVNFDPYAPIEKAWSSESCDSVVFVNEGTAQGQNVYSRKRRRTELAAEPTRYSDVAVGDLDNGTLSAVSAGLCNDGPAEVTTTLIYHFVGQGVWVTVGSGPVPAHYARFWRGYKNVTCDAPVCPPAGNTCGGQPCVCALPVCRPTRYIIEGVGGSPFRLHSAEVRAIPRPIL